MAINIHSAQCACVNLGSYISGKKLAKIAQAFITREVSYEMQMKLILKQFVSPSLNVSTTPLRQLGYWQCLPFSWTTLRGKHCRHPIAAMGVVFMFGPSASYSLTCLQSFLLAYHRGPKRKHVSYFFVRDLTALFL